MEHKVILTESQIRTLVENQILMESMFKNVRNFSDLLKIVKNLAFKGVLTASLITNICLYYQLNDAQKEQIQAVAEETTEVVDGTTSSEEDNSPWQLACGGAIATVYNAVAGQCNPDYGRTASMFRLNIKNPESHRIIAIERTMMDRYGLKMGDVVYLEGVGEYDGVWQVQDKMNKRFAGMDKIDLLVNGDTKTGKWDNVKIYTLKDKSLTSQYKSELAPQLSKDAFNAQFKKKV
jgi:hypothetical protein